MAQDFLQLNRLLNEGYAAYTADKFADAERTFAKIRKDFAGTKELDQVNEKLLRLIAISQLRQNKLKEAIATIDEMLKTYPKSLWAEEMLYWKALCLMQLNDLKAAAETFEKYTKDFPGGPRFVDALFNKALILQQLKDWKALDEYLLAILPKLPPKLQSRGKVLRLMALEELENLPAATELVLAFDQNDKNFQKVTLFSALAIQLGDKLLAKNEYRTALKVLQKVWSREKVLARQQARLKDVQAELDVIKSKRGDTETQQKALEQLIQEIQSDIELIKGIENYDTALNYRIAQCFYQIKRFPEAYLVFDKMVAKLPPSDLLVQANYQMLVCLTQMERWHEAVEAATKFEQKNPDAKEIPNVLYLKGEAQMRMWAYGDAAKTFEDLAIRFPQFQEAERSHFLAGYCLLMLDKNPEAVALFDRHRQKFPQSNPAMAEDVDYWQAMGLYYGKFYDKSREAHGKYMEKYVDGKYRIDSIYRRAHALYGQQKFVEAGGELETFLKEHPTSLVADEAWNLLGDCYFAQGLIDEGIAAYLKTSQKDHRLYDYAYFRIGKAYKTMEEYAKLQEHFEKFLQDRPGSSRVAEAISNLAWLYRHYGDNEKARQIYWEAVQKYGNDPGAAAVESMLESLGKMYRGDDRPAFVSRLKETQTKAKEAKQHALAARLQWILAKLEERANPEISAQLMAQVADLAPPRELSALLLAAAGDALREKGEDAKALEMYRTILYWWPNSPFRDRSFAGMGMLAQRNGRLEDAITLYNTFERVTGGGPVLAGQVAFQKAKALADLKRVPEAIECYESVLKNKSAKGKKWAEALYSIGDLYAKQGDHAKAIAYFQRIYILHLKWSELVAKAYWLSGQSFEKINQKDNAISHYQELVANHELRVSPEYDLAVNRLKELGAPLTNPNAKPIQAAEAAETVPDATGPTEHPPAPVSKGGA